MKIFSAILISVSLSIFLFSAFTQMKKPVADQLKGAWTSMDNSEEQVLVFIDDYFTYTGYAVAGKKFIGTRGGPYSVHKNVVQVTYEFDTNDPEQVGKAHTYAFVLKGDELVTHINGKKQTWKRVDDGSAPLAGLWQITQRKQEDKLVPIHQTGTRKTIKILSGSRFQWAAIDPGKREFSGTGGGRYSFKDGKYTEHIEFFSRDSSRVGASLSFEGRLENGDWHHSGLSSRGAEIYEVWSRRNIEQGTRD